MHFIGQRDVRDWLGEGQLAVGKSIGRRPIDVGYLEEQIGLPMHLVSTLRGLEEEGGDATLGGMESIPFYSLCKGLFLPLSTMSPEKAGALFGIAVEPPPGTAGRHELLQTFLEKDLGMSLVQKLGAVMGDPFQGRPATLRRDSLIRLLLSIQMTTRRQLLDRLTVVGDVAVLFAEATTATQPPGAKLTAVEVLETLRMMARKGVGRAAKFDILRSLMARMGKLEAYFLAKLVLRKAGFGFDYEGSIIAKALGSHFGALPEAVAHAMALTDVFEVARVLAEDGPEGLRKIRLQPLVPVRPALASGHTEQIKEFPVWVERKYDGIRFMLHKSTDAGGSMLAGAYTRNRKDWLEMVPGLDATVRSLPARNCIVDGELYGTVFDGDGARPATVYEVYGSLQGEGKRPVNLKFAAFDLVYLNNQDLTPAPLQQRRNLLQQLVSPLANMPLPIPMSVAEGHLANNKDDVNRLYGHFRSQGYEGLITKNLATPYLLSSRDPTWLKRKPAITLDLVLLGAVFAVTEKKKAGLFGSYVIGARTAEGGFLDVGDVAGVDVVRDQQIQSEVMREGLITGQRIERKSSSGVRPGMDLRPHIVVTVRFEGIIKDSLTGDLKLRDPKMVAIRSDKGAGETNKVSDLEAIFLRQRVG